MQELYDNLAQQLSEATVNPEGMSQFFVKNKERLGHKSVVSHFVWECVRGWLIQGPLPRQVRTNIQQSFVNCTKLDVGMNGLMQRSKILNGIKWFIIFPKTHGRIVYFPYVPWSAIQGECGRPLRVPQRHQFARLGPKQPENPRQKPKQRGPKRNPEEMPRHHDIYGVLCANLHTCSLGLTGCILPPVLRWGGNPGN